MCIRDRYNGENFLSFETYLTYVDLGAYNGATVYELLGKAAALQKIYAVEPDKKTFKRLSSFCSGLSLKLDGINIKPKICVPQDGYTDIWAQPGTFGSLSVCAVSYTHLDVYKRQKNNCPQCHRRPKMYKRPTTSTYIYLL